MFDWNGGTAVDGKLMKELICDKDTQIDFNFPQGGGGIINVSDVSLNSPYGYKSYVLVFENISCRTVISLTMQ
jgi:hypothetical protein